MKKKTNFMFMYEEFQKDLKDIYKSPSDLRSIAINIPTAKKYMNYLTKFSTQKGGERFTSFRSNLVEFIEDPSSMRITLSNFNGTLLSLVYSDLKF
jgi:hypothetical protein